MIRTSRHTALFGEPFARHLFCLASQQENTMKYSKAFLLAAALTVAATVTGCASNNKLKGQAIPQSGFLPNYNLLTEVGGMPKDVKMWRYRNASINPATYTAIIIDPIATDSGGYNKDVTPEIVAQTRAALQTAVYEAVDSRRSMKIVTTPGPGVARISVAITGAEIDPEGLKLYNFTPVGLVVNGAAYAGGVNSKIPAMVVESRIVDSVSRNFLGGGVLTVQGDSFRTGTGSVEAFQNMAKRAVQAAVMGPAQ
jgi:hypothetical protein